MAFDTTIDVTIRELYQELIVDHGTQPKNFYLLEEANQTAEGFNPLCGDKIKLYIQVEGDTLQKISFQGDGCAISIASASLLTEHLQGLTIDEALNVFQHFQSLVKNESKTLDSNITNCLGKLVALAGVRAFPSRVKCATLAWHTLKSALLTESQEHKIISTE